MNEYPICRHIKTNGLQCHAPALAGNAWCYFHNRLHARHHRFRPNDANREYFNRGRDLELCALEDRESVQLAISVVINALATNAIDTRRATALLYGLQLASANAVRLNNAPETPEVVRTVDSSPEGLDLAEPGAIIEVYTRLESRDANSNHQAKGRYAADRSNRGRHSDSEPAEGEESPHFADATTEAQGPNEEPAQPPTNPSSSPSNAAPSTAVP